jgi:hypothetical protein
LTPHELLVAVNRRPFVPFRLLVQMGAPVEVHRPDLVLVGRFSCVRASQGMKSSKPVPRDRATDNLHRPIVSNTFRLFQNRAR